MGQKDEEILPNYSVNWWSKNKCKWNFLHLQFLAKRLRVCLWVCVYQSIQQQQQQNVTTINLPSFTFLECTALSFPVLSHKPLSTSVNNFRHNKPTVKVPVVLSSLWVFRDGRRQSAFFPTLSRVGVVLYFLPSDVTLNNRLLITPSLSDPCNAACNVASTKHPMFQNISCILLCKEAKRMCSRCCEASVKFDRDLAAISNTLQ